MFLCMFVSAAFLWTRFSSAHQGICPFSWFVADEPEAESSVAIRCRVPAHEKGLMCNRLKQALLSYTTLIADQGESLPLWDWVSGLTQLQEVRVGEIPGR